MRTGKKVPSMSPQLAISSLFSVLALGGLCLSVGLAPVPADEWPAHFAVQAEPSPGQPG